APGRAHALLRRQALARPRSGGTAHAGGGKARARAGRPRAVARSLGAERARAGFLSQAWLPASRHADFRRRYRSADRSCDAARAGMSIHIEHVGLWVRDIDSVAAFYRRYIGARVGSLYQNPRKGFSSRFLTFDSGARLEIMTRADVHERPSAEQLGLAHVAITIGD